MNSELKKKVSEILDDLVTLALEDQEQEDYEDPDFDAGWIAGIQEAKRTLLVNL